MNAQGQRVDVRRVIATVIADLRASGDTGMVENLLEADAAIAKKAIISDDLLKAAIQVWAACRNGTEPDLIELADSIDAAGGKELRKAALSGSTP